MEWNDRIRCRNCRGLNEAGRMYCSVCGAPLPRKDDRGRASIARRVARGVGALVLAVALLGVAYGIYWAADHYFLDALGSVEEEQVGTVTTVTEIISTTTTTEPAREDRVIAAGADRYATAINITKLGFPEGAPALVLVAGDDFPEGMVAAPLAAAYKGAILLVPPDGLTEELSAEIARLGPTRVFLVGVARPTRVTNQLTELLQEPEIENLAGDDAYETAALVAKQVAAELGTVKRVVIVSSAGFADAIAVGPLAAANGWPLLLAREDGELPRTTTRAISDLEVTEALVVGLETELDLDTVERQAGADSDETAALVAAYAAEQGLDFVHTVLVSGDGFPEALVAAPYVALDKGMLLLAKGGELPAATKALLDENLEEVATLDFIALPALAKEMKQTAGGASGTTSSAGTSTTRSSSTTSSTAGR